MDALFLKFNPVITMEDQSKIQQIFHHVENYISTTIELYKLKAYQKVAQIATTVITSVLMGFFGVLFLIFVSIGLAVYLGEVMGRMHYGFMIVAGIYLVLAIIVYALSKKVLKDKFNTMIVRKIFKD